MPIFIAYSNTNSSWGTEYSLTTYSTTIASRMTGAVVSVAVDVSALQSGDTYRLRVYEKARSTDTQRVAAEWYISGPQSEPVFITPGIVLIAGWDVTLQRIAGTDRTITWSVRMVS